MLKKVLIINRGEIVNRIKKTLDKLNISSVVFESEKPEDYFNIPKILSFIKQEKIDSVHPGYGFLSENANFASVLKQNNIQFIGPDIKFLELFGNKNKTKKLANDLKIPTTPKAEKNIFPIIVKRYDGAGGRGTFLVSNPNELNKIKGEFYLEKYLDNAQQIEAQVISDGINSQIIGYRNGSIQLRNQKMIEFSYFPDSQSQKQLDDIWLKIMPSFNGYKGLATIEFLLDKNSGKFYFMEINPRIQVEHSVTEESQAIDLVEIQIKIANGEKLPEFKQKKIYAIENRIMAINSNTLLPNPGKIREVKLPKSNNLRIDNGFLKNNAVVSPFFDPLLAKYITTGKTFIEAKNNMISALNQTTITGLHTNIDLLKKVLNNQNFSENSVRINFLEQS
jgi:acetyl-CoA carboxylase biotin carboxylase subunit